MSTMIRNTHALPTRAGAIRRGARGLSVVLLAWFGLAGPASGQSDGVWEVFLNGNEMRDLVSIGDTLYIATTGGAVRYLDGEFTQWNRQPFGILSDSARVVAQDPDGDVWFGTERAGISILRSASERWSPFTSILEPIPGDRIRAVRFQRSAGGVSLLLVGAEEGYSIFADGNLRFVCQEGVDICDLPSFDVLDLCYLADELFLATAGGVVAQLPDGRWLDRSAGLPPSAAVLSALTLWEGQLIGAGANEVYLWDGQEWGALGAGLPAAFAPRGFAVAGSGLWVAGQTSGAFADQGVFSFAAGSWTRVGTRVLPATGVARTSSGKLFATATDPSEQLDGLWEFDGSNWIQRKVAGPPLRAHYRSVFVDETDRLWFSTAESGRDPLIGTFDGEVFTVKNGGQGGALRAWTWSIIQQGDLFFLAHCCCGANDATCRLERFAASAEEFTAVDGIREAWSLDRDEDGSVWASTNNGSEELSKGVFRYWPATGEIENFHPGNTEMTARQNPAIRAQTGRVWIGSFTEGLDLWDFGFDGLPYSSDLGDREDDDDWIHFSSTGSAGLRIIGDGVQRLEIGSDGRVWIGTTEGLSIYRDGSLVNYGPRFDRVPTAEITALAPTPDGGAWVASRNGGLTRMRPDGSGGFQFTNFRAPLLPNPNIESLAVSRDGESVWCGTTRGLAKFTPIDRAAVDASNLGAFPNPWIPDCSDGIRLIGAGGLASGVVVDLEGRLLHRFEEVAPDAVVWDGRVDGRSAPPGLYLIRLRGTRGVQSLGIAVLDGPCP